MFRKLLPREIGFFDFFEQHNAVAQTACKELLELTQKMDDVPLRCARIKELEHEADNITHRCIESLHSTFITPMERADIQKLIQRLDDIVDSIDAAAGKMAIYEIAEARPEAPRLAEVLVRATEQLGAALKLMRNLKDEKSIRDACVAVHKLENDGDEVLKQAIARLFKEETNAITVIKWNEVFETLERAVDKCEDCADIIQGVLIEAS